MHALTPQETFWAGKFGTDYVERNKSVDLVASKTAMFAKILARTSAVRSVRELGANIGLNLLAIRNLLPDAELQAVEINAAAHEQLKTIPGIQARHGSLFDSPEWAEVDLSFTVGVLIHVNPEILTTAYQRLYEASRHYVLVAEYYNPSPVDILYRGETEKLFKRDFAGELMQQFRDLELVDYGFVYRGDPTHPADDLTWFLMRKGGGRNG